VIVIAYDGSKDAKAAVTQAGKLFSGQRATVVTVWQRFVDTMARVGGIGVVLDYQEIDDAAEKNAAERADEGAQLAKLAGLDAVAKTMVAEVGVADAILEVAVELDADAVVTGTRGFGSVKSTMLGSVSHQLTHHSDRPVVVIPSPDVAKERREHLAHI